MRAIRLALLLVLSTTAQSQTPVNLRVLYRVLVNGTDRMTTFGPGERGLFSVEGPLYYIPQNPFLGGEPLYRLLSFSGIDHADSPITLPGYSTEFALGYPWQSPSLPA